MNCPKLNVSWAGEDQQEFNEFWGRAGHMLGTYVISADKAHSSPKKPVWKKPGYDVVIYYYPNSDGWRLGSHDGLSRENEGDHFFKSK